MRPVSIKRNKNFSNVDDIFFVKKNFLSKENYNMLLLATKKLTEDQWDTHPTDDAEHGKISINLHETWCISQELIDLIIPKYWVNDHKTVNRMNTGDNPAEFGWDSWGAADYLAVFYFGDFEGNILRQYKLNDNENFKKIEIETNALYLLPVSNKERYISEGVSYGTKYTWVDWVYKHHEWAIP
jgi:hypothetical protein